MLFIINNSYYSALVASAFTTQEIAKQKGWSKDVLSPVFYLDLSLHFVKLQYKETQYTIKCFKYVSSMRSDFKRS